MKQKTVDQHGQNVKLRPGVPSVYTRQLADFLERAEQDQFSYTELSAVIGANVQGEARSYLLAARSIALREKSMVFRAVRNEGIRRLSSREVALLEDRFQHVRRTHKQTIRELSTVDMDKITSSERASAAGKLALASLTVHTHDPKQIKRLESAVRGKQRLELEQTLNIFKESA